MDSWKSWRRKLGALRALPWADRRLLLQAWLLLLAVDVGLRLLPFRRVQQLLSARGMDRARRESTQVAATITRCQSLVDSAAHHHLYPMHCLRQSLVLQWLLSRRGIATSLRFGVEKGASALAAHAWLEYDGQPIGQRAATIERFVPLKASR